MTLADGGPMTSAGARAEELWRRVAETKKQAEAWERGALGEEATARLLSQLAGTGWIVRNDLRLPDSRANVDHVVIGPGGLLVVDTKNYSGRVTVGNTLLWHNGRSMRRELETARRHTAVVRSVLSLEPMVPVRTLLVIHGATLAAGQFELDDLIVLSPTRLVSWIRSLPPVCPQREVIETVACLDACMKPYLGDTESGSAAAPRPRAGTHDGEERPSLSSLRDDEPPGGGSIATTGCGQPRLTA